MSIRFLTLKDCQKASCLHQDVFYKGWEEKAFRNLLQDPLVEGLKLEKNRELCGYVLWREVENEAEILTFVVIPALQRKGRGSLLLASLIKHLKAKGVVSLFLEVAEDNPSAQSFYKKHGFSFLSKRPNYYVRKEKKLISALNFFKKIV